MKSERHKSLPVHTRSSHESVELNEDKCVMNQHGSAFLISSYCFTYIRIWGKFANVHYRA